MRKLIYRAMILGVVGLLLLAPLIALSWKGRGYPWWAYLVAIVGGGYLIPVFVPVFGNLLEYKLEKLLQKKVGRAASFVVRVLAGMLALVAFHITVDRSTEMWLFRSSRGLALLIIFGLLYAGIPIVCGWDRRIGTNPRRPN